MLAIEVNHKWDACSSKNNTQAPVHPHIKLSKYQTRIIWTWWKLAWRYSHASSGALFLLSEFVPACPLLQKGLGHLAAPYLLLLLVARYNLSYHKTICYHLFQYLQRIPCWKLLIISFCSSLGSTLLLIKRVLMTHKYRGSIVVLLISKSVEPNEEQKEMISGFQQGIFFKHWNNR